ncbi:membrane protein [Candidatus Mancarchaeum acidiphilum]|uniref:Membrane protein n=1 Tax=Candidatus Mancarchaeum acidiphilum TaxID=1920749 RepID=A0A218NLU7_9ARCH|nr:hypothetical protein [Candidatus Mancarchaeum acidiphilum]ASI13445.1 membrane protein [Candidatus Mancarchaeum acidiphilum]
MKKLIVLMFALLVMSGLGYISAQSAQNSSLQPSYVRMIEPYSSILYANSSVYLGKVAPGQTFYVTISSTSLNKNNKSINLGWNHFVAYGLPKGWVVENSSYNINEPSVKIKAASNASYGIYNFTLEAVNSGDIAGIGEPKIHAEINVSKDVIKLYLPYTSIKINPLQASIVYVIINNTGVSDNPFIIGSTGVPGWNFTQSVISKHGSSNEFAYPVKVDAPGIYTMSLYVRSATSPEVYESENISVTARSTLFTDYNSIGSGSVLFPIIYAPVDAVMYLIGVLVKVM